MQCPECGASHIRKNGKKKGEKITSVSLVADVVAELDKLKTFVDSLKNKVLDLDSSRPFYSGFFGVGCG